MISGNNIVWQSWDGNDEEIYFWDGSTTTQITDNATYDGDPAISGSNVVWVAGGGSDSEIYLWDGSNTTQITDNAIEDREPAISGNNIVWMGNNGVDYEIYFTTVPEPATGALLGLGFLALLRRNNRNRCGK